MKTPDRKLVNNRKYYWKNRDKICAHKRSVKGRRNYRSIFVKSKYGLSSDKYFQMLGEQNGLCKICGMINDGYELCVDHDHKTGEVRGLLCNGCNVGIGSFRDDKDLLLSASLYVGMFGG